jgi:hypothetical protein
LPLPLQRPHYVSYFPKDLGDAKKTLRERRKELTGPYGGHTNDGRAIEGQTRMNREKGVTSLLLIKVHTQHDNSKIVSPVFYFRIGSIAPVVPYINII